ncbi:PTS sugar transporter subunit IIA [Desulfobacterales bacterium HSG2]|nr:PTS sugar transporter subunit IIA [Desulfobacterales bacterium HSG2]
MKIWKNLRPEDIFLGIPCRDKEAVLHFIADAYAQNSVAEDAQVIYKGLRDREETMSTGVGGGVAFPHTASREAEDATVLLLRPLEPVEFDSLDGRPVDIILPIVIPENETALHLQILAGISRLCRNPNILKAVRTARDSAELWEKIRDMEEKMPFH